MKNKITYEQSIFKLKTGIFRWKWLKNEQKNKLIYIEENATKYVMFYV